MLPTIKTSKLIIVIVRTPKEAFYDPFKAPTKNLRTLEAFVATRVSIPHCREEVIRNFFMQFLQGVSSQTFQHHFNKNMDYLMYYKGIRLQDSIYTME